MNCPYCREIDNRVVDTRDVPDGIRRRRECNNCEQRFTTYERIAGLSLLIVKRDGRREEFSGGKLLKSIAISCTKRPIPTKKLQKAARDIETDLYALAKSEVKSLEIGRLVMDYLQKLDDVAYVRYASVYRRFQDVDTMAAEIKDLLERKRRAEEQKNQIPLPLDQD